MSSVEYDLHGTVGIRLIDPAPADVAAVDRQLGPIRGPLPAGPSITVRFVDRLPTGQLSLAGVRESGWSADQFLVLRSAHKVPARVVIPIDQVGESLEMIAERGLPAVPLLVPILNLAALHAGVLPLHAAGLVHHGRGIVVTGWSKGGKTETLLAFLRQGASYVGDEWLYLKPDGTMHGIPEPIRLWRWHLQRLRDVARRVPTADRLRMSALASLRAIASTAPTSVPLARRVRHAVDGQLYVDLAIKRLGVPTQAAARVDLVCFVESHTASGVEVDAMEGAEVAARMAHSLAYERRELLGRAYEYRYAFPHRPQVGIETAGQVEADLLTRLVAPLPALRLRHPYPVNIESLFDALAPRIQT